MESTDQAKLQLFPIGPVTSWGMALALKVLFCKQMKFLVRLLSSTASWQLQRVKKLGFLVFGSMAAVVGAGCLLRRSRLESLNLKTEHAFSRRYAQNMMQTAATYEEWASGASMLEKESGCRKDSHLYDEELVRAKLNELRHRRTECGIEEMMFCLRADLVRNLGNMCNPELHKGRLQTPPLIQEYIKEVKLHLQAICAADPEELTIEEKIAFIHETRHAFGRTALLLSGGAALGLFHLGVVRTLIEHKLLPRVIAGASAGSILCSFVATRTWAELQIFFDDPTPQMNFFSSMGSIFAIAHRILTRGFVQEIGVLQRRLRQLIGDLTFQEAYDLSGRVLGISVCSPRRHEPPRLLNYLTSPHVVIWSAVTASCAFPGLFEAQELMAKDRQGLFVPYHALSQVGPEEPGLRQRKWRDGGLESDLPMRQLKELFNVNHFIVSQANPHTAPLLRLKELVRVYGGNFAAKLAHLAEMEVKHRCNQVVEMGFGLHGIAKVFAQDWEGDVTIVLPATFAQFAKIIQNPTPSELRKYIMQGRRCTWAKLSAIEANCGIELMLDECVSELNKRRRAKKEAERNTSHSNNMRVQPAKRIPSWNCIARESSWGSLDEDSLESALQPGGPWGGPTLRKLKPVRNHVGSDSNSGAENMDLSWTKAGGPLMRTASAAKYVLVLEAHGDNKKDAQQVVENGVETKTRSMNNQKIGQPLTITVGLKSNGSSNTQKDNADGEDNKFSFFLQNGLRKSASVDMLFDREHCLWKPDKKDKSRDAEAEYQAFSLNDCSKEDSPFPSPKNAPCELPGRLSSGYKTASLREGDHRLDFSGFMPRSFSLDGLMMKPKGRTKSLDRGFGSLIFNCIDADDAIKAA